MQKRITSRLESKYWERVAGLVRYGEGRGDIRKYLGAPHPLRRCCSSRRKVPWSVDVDVVDVVVSSGSELIKSDASRHFSQHARDLEQPRDLFATMENGLTHIPAYTLAYPRVADAKWMKLLSCVFFV